jgi:ribonuclease P protein component
VVAAGGEGFPRARRVRKRLDYLRIQNQGRRYSTPHFLVFAMPSSSSPLEPSKGSRAPTGSAKGSGPPAGPTTPTRFGVTVSRKVGDAVTRNRVKRWIRESCRRLASSLPPSLDIVVVARPQAARAGFAPISAELASLTKRLR